MPVLEVKDLRKQYGGQGIQNIVRASAILRRMGDITPHAEQLGMDPKQLQIAAMTNPAVSKELSAVAGGNKFAHRRLKRAMTVPA